MTDKSKSKGHVGHDVRYIEVGSVRYRAAIHEDGTLHLTENEGLVDVQDSLLWCHDCGREISEYDEGAVLQEGYETVYDYE